MKLSFFIVPILFIICSCDDASLNIEPKDQLTDATVWKTPENANLFLNDIYNQLNPGPVSSVWTALPSEISNDPLDNYSDNSVSGNLAGIPSFQNFTQGAYGPSVPIFNNHWRNMYANIRKCNILIEKVSSSEFSGENKKSLISQGMFLRAYFYKSLIDIYGGVPLITKPLDRISDGDEIFKARNTYEECVDFIQKECESAAQDLPLVVTGKDIGRATKGAAWALKGELELYAGKWSDAVSTNLKIIESEVYDLYPDYESLFYEENENNEEVIFDIQYAPEIRGVITEKYWNPAQTSDGTGWQAVNPTQNLIDDYEFLDGKTKTEGSIYYDSSSPYENREERFYSSIIYDGSEWKNDVIYTRLGVPNNKNEFGLAGATRTGYYLRKKVNPDIVPGNSSGQNSIVWRYAEILLNYAEAKNEIDDSPDQGVYDAINKIRQRSGQPILSAGFTKDEMREKIRRERRIELAFEGKRLYDIWRWKIANVVFEQPLKAMKITGDDQNLDFEIINIDGGKIIFDQSKNYLMPIPESVIARNSKIEQNPGY